MVTGKAWPGRSLDGVLLTHDSRIGVNGKTDHDGGVQAFKIQNQDIFMQPGKGSEDFAAARARALKLLSRVIGHKTGPVNFGEKKIIEGLGGIMKLIGHQATEAAPFENML